MTGIINNNDEGVVIHKIIENYRKWQKVIEIDSRKTIYIK